MTGWRGADGSRIDRVASQALDRDRAFGRRSDTGGGPSATAGTGGHRRRDDNDGRSRHGRARIQRAPRPGAPIHMQSGRAR